MLNGSDVLKWSITLFLLVKLVPSSVCPDLRNLRSENVINKFNLEKLSGLWYEIAYHDIAQLGEKCQFYDKYVESNGVREIFGFTYRDPGSIKLFYTSTNETGLFERYADYPVANKITFPSVVLDFTADLKGDYSTLTEYLCYELGGLAYTEVRIGSRQQTISKGLSCPLNCVEII